MNILHISSMNSPSGLENRLSRFIGALSNQHQQTILVVSKRIHPVLEKYIKTHCLIKHYKYASRYKIPKPFRAMYLRYWLRKSKFDLIICYSQVSNHKLVESIFESSPKSRKIYFEGGILWYKGSEIKKTLGLFDEFIANSSGAEAILNEKFNIPKNKISRVFNGLPSQYLQQAKDECSTLLKDEHGRHILLYVGRLIHQKGVIIPILCMRDLPDNYVLWVVGHGPDEAHFRKVVSEFNLLSKVKFWGFQENIQAFYRSASLMILPSISESMSNAILEAGAYGLPCVAANIDGNTDLIENDISGWLINPSLSIEDEQLGLPPQKMPEKVYSGETSKLESPKAIDPKVLAQSIIHITNDIKKRRSAGLCMQQRVQGTFSMEASIEKFQATLNKTI